VSFGALKVFTQVSTGRFPGLATYAAHSKPRNHQRGS
jgi:hypothetical protein